MLYGFLAVLALGILIIVHEWGHYIVARLCNMRVDRFAIGFGPALFRRQRGETVFQVGAIPFGGFVQIAGLNPEDEAIDANDPRAYPNRPAYQRFLTIAAGPLVNYVFAVLLMFGLRSLVSTDGALAGAVMPDRPAAQAGLVSGDRFVRIDGRAIGNTDQVPSMIENSQGHPLTIEVLRDGQARTLTVTPMKDGTHWRIGVQVEPITTVRFHDPLLAARQSLVAPIALSVDTVRNLWNVIRGRQSADFRGPVGITRMIKAQMEHGVVSGLQLVVIISTLLGLFNLFPLPALDGGRLVFLGWELVTRRPVNQRVEQLIHLVGMVLLLSMLLFLTVKDVRDWVIGH